MTLIPSYFNLFDYFLGEDRLEEIGTRTAIEFRGGRITYSELRREVDYWTEQILNVGVKEGDRVVILLYDSPEFIAIFLAAASVGAIAVPINTFLPPEEVGFIISDCGARAAVVEDELEWKVSTTASEECTVLVIDTSACQHLEPKDEIAPRPPLCGTTKASPAFMLYTSGSTGMPKGVLHNHGAIPVTVKNYSETILKLTPDDRLYSASRLFFAYGLGNSLSFPMAAGATVILDPERATPERVARLFAEQMPTVFFGVPALYNGLLDFKRRGGSLDLSSLRLCISAGEALPSRIVDEWGEEFNLPVLDGIGSTEMLHIFISNREERIIAGSSGSIVKGFEAILLDEHGIETIPGEPGNLWVRGESATVGYWNRPDLTAGTIRDGWVKTGDIYRIEEGGYFFHVGRSDDCFKVKGLWVSPIEVESALLGHPSVIEAAVVEAKDKGGLATVRAFVVIRQGIEREGLKDELRSFAAARLPQHKLPSQIEFLKELPRTATGKVQRYKLRTGTRPRPPGGKDDK
ncbi:MAG TPA: benzoate-CoA ligase family protein [Blastocatellia bacterium]|nr:benzoate-CoA ligase family protein [Blastocatellia bacterium]